MAARLDPVIERFRFSHHAIAQYFAMGMRVNEVARKTGFTHRRLVLLLDDPTFQELIEHYRTGYMAELKIEAPNVMDQMIRTHQRTVEMIADWLEYADETGERIPIPQLIRIHESLADRVGYSKHTLKTVLNVSLADQLERCIERADRVREVKVIEEGVIPAEPNPIPSHSAELIPLPTFRRS